MYVYVYTQLHIESNAPPKITKHIPSSIEDRVSNLSSNQKLFQEPIAHYEDNEAICI